MEKRSKRPSISTLSLGKEVGGLSDWNGWNESY